MDGGGEIEELIEDDRYFVVVVGRLLTLVLTISINSCPLSCIVRPFYMYFPFCRNCRNARDLQSVDTGPRTSY